MGHSAHGRGYFLQTVPKSLESYDVTAAQYAKRFEGADRVLVQAYITHKGPKNKNFVALKTRATRDDQNVYEWAPPQNSLEVNEAEEGKEDSNTLLDELTDIVGIDLGLKIRTIVKVIESMSDQPTVVGLKHGSHSAKPYPIVSFVLTVDSDSRYGPDGKQACDLDVLYSQCLFTGNVALRYIRSTHSRRTERC